LNVAWKNIKCEDTMHAANSTGGVTAC